MGPDREHWAGHGPKDFLSNRPKPMFSISRLACGPNDNQIYVVAEDGRL
jgi:hypothetical protein